MHKNKKRLEGGNLYDRTVKAWHNLSEKTQEKVSNTVTKGLVKKAGMSNENTPDNLKKYCNIVLGLISATKYDPTGVAINKIRNNISENLPKDIISFLKEGKSKDEIIDWYWQVSEFQLMFNKLGWDKDTLEGLVESQI